MKKKILALILGTTLTIGVLGGCAYEPNNAQQEKKQTEQLMNEISSQVGMPNITNFYEKKLAKKIFELRDDSKLITYAYTQNMDGKYVYLGTCIGYGLPYSVQYTAPESYQRAYNDSGNGYDYQVLPQADPNGLYMPDGLSATWLILVDEETGEQSIIYAEPEIVVTQSKLPKRLCEEWSLPNNY